MIGVERNEVSTQNPTAFALYFRTKEVVFPIPRTRYIINSLKDRSARNLMLHTLQTEDFASLANQWYQYTSLRLAKADSPISSQKLDGWKVSVAGRLFEIPAEIFLSTHLEKGEKLLGTNEVDKIYKHPKVTRLLPHKGWTKPDGIRYKIVQRELHLTGASEYTVARKIAKQKRKQFERLDSGIVITDLLNSGVDLLPVFSEIINSRGKPLNVHFDYDQYVPTYILSQRDKINFETEGDVHFMKLNSSNIRTISRALFIDIGMQLISQRRRMSEVAADSRN